MKLQTHLKNQAIAKFDDDAANAAGHRLIAV